MFLDTTTTNKTDEQVCSNFKFRAMRGLLLCTGLSFRHYGVPPRWSTGQIVRFFLAIIYIVVVCYVWIVSYVGNPNFPSGYKTTNDRARTAWLVCSIFICIVFMIFFVYWELRGSNERALAASLQFDCDLSEFRRTDWPLRFLFAIFVTLITMRVFDLILGVVLFRAGKTPTDYWDFAMFSLPFGGGFGAVLTAAIVLHVHLIHLIVFFYFSICAFSLRYRLTFLKREFQLMGETSAQNGEKHAIADDPLAFYPHYRHLLLSVSEVVSHFQPFRICAIGTMGLITSITMWFFGANWGTNNFFDFIHLAVQIGTQCGLLSIVIYAPRYEFARLFVDMAEYVQEQISVWGVTDMARKPVIVTIGFVVFLFALLFSKIISPAMKELTATTEGVDDYDYENGSFLTTTPNPFDFNAWH
ncbi:hypothetical protein M3Y99_00571400 [Aphelenchoides fujianensis]|nr:hypothetical protein M3Y99_00571400 [Aphelenchoides fujianensis]